MTVSDCRTRRFLAIWFPYLAAERWRGMQTAAPPDDQPVVLYARDKGTLRLTAIDAAAARCGLAPQLPLADARVRFPHIIADAADPVSDVRLLERLGYQALAATPLVALDWPDGLILDISGCAHLFGGEEGIPAYLTARLKRSAFPDGDSLSWRYAFADHPDAARALARWGDLTLPQQEAIGALPLAALELDADSQRGLERAGLKTIAMVASRSMPSLAARFGEGAVRALRRLQGEEARPLDYLMPPVSLHAVRRFAEPIGRQDHILTVVEQLAAQLAERLEEQHQGARALLLHLFRSDGDIRSLTIETGLPMRDAVLLRRLFEERIDTLADPLDPGFGYDMLRLCVTRSERLASRQCETGGETREEETLSLLLDRLTTRLGPMAIRRLLPCDSHMPERAQRAVPATQAKTREETSWSPPAAGEEPPTRPLWLFDPPEAVDVLAEIPDSPPRWFRWRGKRYDVALSEGPERIAGEWWRARRGHWPGHGGPGQGERTRDYYRIEDQSGHRFWLFRAGFYGDAQDSQGPAWFIHGLFA